MNFENALTLLKEGKRVQREGKVTLLLKDKELVISNFLFPYFLTGNDLLANDWELAEWKNFQEQRL